MKHIKAFSRRLWGDCSGGTVIEYALIAGLIVIGLIVAVTSIGTSTSDAFTGLDTKWDAAEVD